MIVTSLVFLYYNMIYIVYVNFYLKLVKFLCSLFSTQFALTQKYADMESRIVPIIIDWFIRHLTPFVNTKHLKELLFNRYLNHLRKVICVV